MAKIVELQSPNRPRTTIGQMRQQVKVLTYGDSPFGEHSLDRNYIEVATVRARVDNISGSASREGKGIDSNITHTIIIRKPEFELTTENMLEWVHPGTNEHLRIRQVRPVGKTSIDPRQQFVMMLCESQGLVIAFENPSPEPIVIPQLITIFGATGTGQYANGDYDFLREDSNGYAVYDHQEYPGQFQALFRIQYSFWSVMLATTEYYRNESTVSKLIPKTEWEARSGEGTITLEY